MGYRRTPDGAVSSFFQRHRPCGRLASKLSQACHRLFPTCVYDFRQGRIFPACREDSAMKLLRPVNFLRVPLVLAALLVGLHPSSADAQSFQIAAANVTMPATGGTSSAYTVSAIPLTGTLGVSCQYAGPATQARIPECVGSNCFGPCTITSVTAGQTVTGKIFIYPYGTPLPVTLRRAPGRSTRTPVSALILSGAVLLGLGLRRRRRQGVSLFLLAVSAFVLTTLLPACSGAGDFNGTTPGTYAYTLTADNESGGQAPLGQAVTTTIFVTVP